jgi:hypothetical protein
MKKEFKLTEEQYERLIEASQPVPYLVVGGVEPMSPCRKAESIWMQLGEEMGFKWNTAEPIPGKNRLYFHAEEI